MKIRNLSDRLYENDYLYPATLGSIGIGDTALGAVCELVKVPEHLNVLFMGSGAGVTGLAGILACGVAVMHKLGVEVPAPIGKS